MREFLAGMWVGIIMLALVAPDDFGAFIGRVAAHSAVAFQDEMQRINQQGEE